MKNNIILKGMFLLAVLCAAEFVSAKKGMGVAVQQQGQGRVPQMEPLEQRAKGNPLVLQIVPAPGQSASQAPARTTSAPGQQPSAPQVTIGQVVPLGSRDIATLRTWEYPLTPEQNQWLYNNGHRMTQDQKQIITDKYNKYQARLSRPGIAPVFGTAPAEFEEEENKTPVAEGAGWSIGGALSGAKKRAEAAAGWGWQKGKGAYEYVSSVPGAIWDYESAIGTGTKALASTGVVAAAPYAAAAVGTTALGLPALAAGVTSYGVLSLLDRLEQRYRTRSWTQSGAIGLERMKLEQDLSDTSAYPTPSIKLEALNSPDEIEIGKAAAENKKARQILEQQLNNMLKNDQVRNFDSAVKTRVTAIRGQLYSPKALAVKNTTKDKKAYLQGYIDYLLLTYKEMDLYSAILSEYRRAEKQLQKLQAAEKVASQPVVAQE